MNEATLQKLLNPLTGITPSPEFAMRSKAQILMSAQEQTVPARVRVRFFESLTVTGAIGLASVLLLVILGSLSYSNQGGSTNSFNSNAIVAEAESANFELHIKEVTYFDESAKQVALALEKIAEADDNKENQE